MSMTTTSKGWILLSHGHQELPDINNADILDALPPEVRDGPRERVRIRGTLPLGNRTDVDWAALQREQAAQVTRSLLPLRNLGHGVAYFGRALLPLAMDLGFRVERWVPSRAFLYHREGLDWRWPGRDPGAPPLQVHVDYHHFPEQPSPAKGDVIVRVGVTHRIAPEDTRPCIPNLIAEVDIHLGEACGDHALQAQEDLERVVDAFGAALHRVHQRFPQASRIHVFAAAPAGLAFRMGCIVNRTVHPPIQTYQFVRNAEIKYQRALIVGDEVRPDMLLNIQFLSAQPRTTKHLRIGEELREIAHRLREGERSDRFDIAEPRPAVRAKDIQSYIRKGNAQIVHLSGHGEQGGVLVLEDASGMPQRVRPDAVRMLFELLNDDGHLRCAVFNACHSDALAKELIRAPAVVPCAIGTSDAVPDKAAIVFADGFYGALADGETLDRAFKAGKVQVGMMCPAAQAELFHISVADEAMRDKPLFAP